MWAYLDELAVVVVPGALVVRRVHGVVALVGLEAAAGGGPGARAPVVPHGYVVPPRHHPHLQLSVGIRVR